LSSGQRTIIKCDYTAHRGYRPFIPEAKMLVVLTPQMVTHPGKVE